MICYSIVFLIVSYSFIEQIHIVSSDDVNDGIDINTEDRTAEDVAVPIEGQLNFSGQANASGTVTIVGSTDPTSDFPEGKPLSNDELIPEEEEIVLIIYDSPGPAHSAWDYGIPPFYMPPIEHAHMGPKFAPIPYGGPMFGHAPGPMAHEPHIIEIFDPEFSPMMSQPPFIEIFDPMTGQPQLIEMVGPGFGMQPIFEPFYTGYNSPFGALHTNVEMVPMLLDFDLSDPMFGQVLEESGLTMNDTRKMSAKRDTQLVPVSGKVTILGKF